MILVTGAYGFIGSKFVKYLNSQGRSDIIVSDYLTNGQQFSNLNDADYEFFIFPDDICLSALKCTGVFHFGAISDTTCWDGELLMKRNYQFTKNLIDQCLFENVPISYSSSASVYGNGDGPLNLYAHSKKLVDDYVGKIHSNLVQGFRYFNVYSTDDAEWHKKDQASPFYKFKQQALNSGTIEIFEGSENFNRDFVHVNRVCEIQWEMFKRNVPGIFDLGSGSQMSFKQIAQQVALPLQANIVTIPFPEKLKGHYQNNTLADMSYFR
jgi:ADP-L-glycero-D-manno-heptose 6-epimerase